MSDLNSTGEIIFKDDHAQDVINVSMSSDNTSQKNIVMILKHLKSLYRL